MESISTDVTHLPQYPDIAILKIKGFIYANTLVPVDKALQTILASRKKKIVFDLTETNYISSGGWALLHTSHQKFVDAGGDFALAGLKPEVQDAFELLEYNKVMRAFPSLDIALKQGFEKVFTPKR